MKKNDKNELKSKNPQELHQLLLQERKNLVETRAKLALGNLKDTSQVKKIKYKIALISTLVNQLTLHD